MFNQIFPYVANVFTFALDTFSRLLNAMGAFRIWLYVIYVLLSYRFILRPVFGWASSSGSDRADKKRKE